MPKLKLVKSDLDDWYTIERAHHDNRHWMEPLYGYDGRQIGHSFQHSGRISDACVEGTLEEMKEIAQAIFEGTRASFKRCAVKYMEDGRVAFWSPRNSQRDGIVTDEEATELAREIMEEANAVIVRTDV